MRKIFLATLILISSIDVKAQQSNFGNWLMYFGNGKINDKWSVWTEAQYRNYNFIGDREQLLLRTAAMYNITPEINVAQGYGFVAAKNYDNTGKAFNTTEHRLYQQVLLKQKFGRVYISHRYRTEERFLHTGFKFRFRYFLSTNVVLNKKKLEKGGIYLSAYNEIFLNAIKPVFDRNRVYGGVGYVFNDKLRAETGIMSQMRENGSRSQFNAIVYHNFDL